MDKSLEVHRNQKYDVFLPSSSFSLNVPPKINQDGFIISEASAMASYLSKFLDYDVKILAENLSHDSVGSIFFSLLMFCEPRKITSIDIFTSDFHFKRTCILTNKINELAFDGKFKFGFYKSFTANSKAKRSRLTHEKRAIDEFLVSVDKIKTKEDFINHLMENHCNYNRLFGGRVNLMDNELY